MKDMYSIAGYEPTIRNFPYRVLKAFDSPEAIIAHILQADEEDLEWLASGNVIMSSKWIAKGKCIPRQCIKANGGKLLDALINSTRAGAREAAAKVEAATAYKR